MNFDRVLPPGPRSLPVTRLYSHLQKLEKSSLVSVEYTRVVSGIVEKHYRLFPVIDSKGRTRRKN